MTVRITTDLPISAAAAFELARKPALFRYVVRGILRVTGLSGAPEWIEGGEELDMRLWLFGVIPAWRHQIRVVRVTPLEIQTSESGGPVRTWSHRLLFEPTSERTSRYTDEVEIEAGPLTPAVWLFAQLMYRYRQRRWRELARVLA